MKSILSLLIIILLLPYSFAAQFEAKSGQVTRADIETNIETNNWIGISGINNNNFTYSLVLASIGSDFKETNLLLNAKGEEIDKAWNFNTNQSDIAKNVFKKEGEALNINTQYQDILTTKLYIFKNKDKPKKENIFFVSTIDKNKKFNFLLPKENEKNYNFYYLI